MPADRSPRALARVVLSADGDWEGTTAGGGADSTETLSLPDKREFYPLDLA